MSIPQQDANAIPAAIVTAIVTATGYGVMITVWLRNFGRRRRREA